LVLGIVISLFLLMILAYRGYSVIFWAPVLAGLAGLTAGYPALPVYTHIFMVKAAEFVENFFPVFVLGAVFGSILQESGAAQALARTLVKFLGSKRAILAVVLTCALLTYGSVSFFVVVFTVFPLAEELFKAAGISRRLIPAVIGLGSFTFTMSALPGAGQIQNLIPTSYFGTTSFAAPLAGILAALLMFLPGLGWLKWRSQSLPDREELAIRQEIQSAATAAARVEREMNSLQAALPVFLVIILNFALTRLISGWDFTALQNYHPAFAQLDDSKQTAVWAMTGALTVGTVAAVLTGWRTFRAEASLIQGINKGTTGSLGALMSSAAGVGFGSVIQALPGFGSIADMMLNIDPGTPLVSEAIAINVLAGITGSASGGITIAMETMSRYYLEWGLSMGVSPEILHRVATLASGGLDTLPHNGAVITVLTLAGLSYKEAYPDLFVITVLLPIISTFATILFTVLTGLY